jgi:hypothetical protein
MSGPYIPRGLRPQLDGTAELEVTYVDCWQKADPKAEADATALWKELGVLPEGVEATERVKELCVLAYAKDELAAISTVVVRHLPFLKNNFGMFRTVVAPKFRRHSLARIMPREARDVLEVWALANPDAGVMGLGTVVQSAEIQAQSRAAVWRTSGLTLVGYNERNEQIRIAWFGHARVF